jgi:hypothetical protein
MGPTTTPTVKEKKKYSFKEKCPPSSLNLESMFLKFLDGEAGRGAKHLFCP